MIIKKSILKVVYPEEVYPFSVGALSKTILMMTIIKKSILKVVYSDNVYTN